MDPLAVLLRQQSDLAKKISDAYNAEAKRKENTKDFFNAVRHRGVRKGLKFMQVMGKMADDNIKSALEGAGWQVSKLTGTVQSGQSVWIKKGSTMKLTIDAGTWKITNGSEVVAGPLPLADLPAYLAQASTQPAQARQA